MARQGPPNAQQNEVIQYITSCIATYIETEGPPACGADKNQDMEDHGYEEGKGVGTGSPAPLKAELLSLPASGGGFAVSEYVGDDIAAFCNADPEVMMEPWLAELLASRLPSGAKIDNKEYAEVIRRLLLANMAELTAESSPHPLGMFAVWKEVDRIQRLIIDGRPVNEYFTSPPYEFTCGEDLSRMQVKLGYLLEAAKCDLCDFFHCCEATDALRKYFGLKGIPAALLRDIGIDVPADRVDSRGMTFPRLTTLPMGFGPSPGIAQSAHECILYGSAGSGSTRARQLEPVVRPEARWSGQRVPDVDSPHAEAPHALIIDDLLMFRQVPQRPCDTRDNSGDASGLGTAGYAAPSPYRTAAGLGPASFAAPSPNNDAAGPGTAGNAAPSPDRTAAGLGPAGFAAPSPNIGAAGLGTAGDAAPSPDRTAAGLGLAGYAAPSPNVGPASCVTDSAGAAGTALETVLQRYAAVHLRTKPSKVQDYNAVQDLVGHTLDHNVLRASCSRYAAIRAEVLRLLRSRWCRPRDIERIVGKLTHIMLLHRQSLALFNAVYAFCRTNWPERPRRLWLSVQQELSDAIALLPLIRSDLSRPVATALLQTDACDTGAAVVYTDKVDHKALRQECARPRRALQEPSEPITPWTAATGLGAAFEASVDPADWHVAVRCTYPVASRARLAHINEKEAGALVLAVRWAARSRRTRRCRIVIQSDSAAAVCAMRKGRSSKRGMRLQCRRLAALTLAHAITAEFRWVATDRNMADRPSRGSARPGPCVEEGAGHDWKRGKRLGEAENPGPGQLQPFWTPLLDGNVKAQTLTRYDAEARHFIEFVRERGDRIHTKEDLDYWMSYYCHIAYTDGYRSKSACEKALAGLEHWLPEFKPLPLTRRCLRGWGRLQPPQPAAPFPRDLVWACATLACLSGDVAAGVAMLVAYDCWLRISEVSGVTVADVYDSRRQVDPVGRGVSVFLPETKTGRRQAVMVEEPAVAALLLALARAQDQRTAKIFPTPDMLRRVLARCLGALNVEAHGLAFVWHGFRHGGASRAFLRGDDLSLILIRGRWAAESSGRHYIQSGRQLLLAQNMPAEVTDLARRIERAGLDSLVARDLRARLR